jgi:hypothetical protein
MKRKRKTAKTRDLKLGQGNIRTRKHKDGHKAAAPTEEQELQRRLFVSCDSFFLCLCLCLWGPEGGTTELGGCVVSEQEHTD